MASLISGLQFITKSRSVQWSESALPGTSVRVSALSFFRQEGSTEASLQRRHPNCTCIGRQDHDSEVAEAVWIAIPWSGGGGGVVTCSSMSQGSSEAERGSIGVDEVGPVIRFLFKKPFFSRLIPPPDVFAISCCRWPGLSGELKS